MNAPSPPGDGADPRVLGEPMRPWPTRQIWQPDRLDVGVVIVNWNTRGLLARVLYGLRHVLAPGNVSDVVVVDNASDDGSVELGRALQEAGVIHLIENTTQRYHGPGLTQGVNHLSDLAHDDGPIDLVWILDSDVFTIRPDALTAAAAALADHGAVFAGERDDYSPGPPTLTDGRLAVCSVLFDPAAVWHPEHRPFLQDGEPSRHMQRDLLERGRGLLAFPFCSAGYVLHVGRSTLAAVEQRDDATNLYLPWAQVHNEPHYGLAPDGPAIAAAYEARYRAAAGSETIDGLVALLSR